MKSLEELPAGLEGVLGALSFAQTSVGNLLYSGGYYRDWEVLLLMPIPGLFH